MTPTDLLSADHWQAWDIARELAFALQHFPLDDADRKRALAEWAVLVEPMIEEHRPDIGPRLREQLALGIAARALILMKHMDRKFSAAGRA